MDFGDHQVQIPQSVQLQRTERTVIMICIFVLFILNIFNRAWCSHSCSQTDFLMSKLKFDTRLEGMVFGTFENIGLMKCSYYCLVYTNCRSYNYHDASGYCELNEEKDSFYFGNITTHIGFVYGSKDDVPRRITGLCESVSCPSNQRCVEKMHGTAYCELAGRVNIALHKTTSQSSMFSAFPNCCKASHAVDGSVSSYWTHWTCSTTDNNDFNPWWTVSLGGQYYITGVEIISAQDTVPERLHDIGIEVFTNSTTEPVCCRFISGSLPTGLSKINCHRPIYGNSLKISIQKSEILMLCEVRVYYIAEYKDFGLTASINGSCFNSYGPNVALNKIVTISGLNATNPPDPASYVVDGNKLNQDNLGATCSGVISSDGLTSWFQLDLAQIFIVESVVIYNTLKHYHDYADLSNVTVSVMETLSDIPKYCAFYHGLFGRTSRILECDTPVTGRYVRISVQEQSMYLCEIEVTAILP